MKRRPSHKIQTLLELQELVDRIRDARRIADVAVSEVLRKHAEGEPVAAWNVPEMNELNRLRDELELGESE